MEGIFHDVFFACFFSLCGSFLMGVIFSLWACMFFLHVSDVIDCMTFDHMNYCFVLHFLHDMLTCLVDIFVPG